jgi:hypothetical protein
LTRPLDRGILFLIVTSINTAVLRGTRSLFELLSDEQIDQIRRLGPDAELETRVAQLAQRANEGELIREEEYRGNVEANSIVAVLRLSREASTF